MYALKTVLTVLIEQSKFHLNFDRFSPDNCVAIFTGIDVHTSNANHEI